MIENHSKSESALRGADGPAMRTRSKTVGKGVRLFNPKPDDEELEERKKAVREKRRL